MYPPFMEARLFIAVDHRTRQDFPRTTGRTGVADEPDPRARRADQTGLGGACPSPLWGSFAPPSEMPFWLRISPAGSQSLGTGEPQTWPRPFTAPVTGAAQACRSGRIEKNLNLEVPAGVEDKAGPDHHGSGILGRSSGSSGFFFITFRMCLGSMCLLTSKATLSTPRRIKVSGTLHSPR